MSATRLSFRTERFEKREQLPGRAIWAARDTHHSGFMVAIKVLERGRCEENGQAFPPLEANLGITLHHPNVVSIVEAVQEPDRVILVEELLTGGDLFTSWRQCFPLFSLCLS
jgi:hypothetical protein